VWRSIIAAALVYGIGHPALESYRPVVFSKPLEGFYRDVNRAAEDGRYVLSKFDTDWVMRLFSKAVDKAESNLKSDE
jgi:uncharacterized membrane protein